MNFNETPEFKKDRKTLGKRVPSINSDLKRIIPKLETLYVKPDGLDDIQWNEHKRAFFDGKRATKLPGFPPEFDVIKIRLDTDTPQYRGKLRLVCVAVVSSDSVTLVELFSKNDKELQNNKLIIRYIRNIS